MENEDIPDSEKVRIASDFILHSPPGEFNEVFNDVRMLLNNDDLLRGGASGAFARYNKDQLTPARVESSTSTSGGSPATTLITEYNDIGGGRFCDPRTKQSFKYDHLRKEATDFRPWAPPPDLAALEGLRTAVEVEAAAYAANHFKHGTCAVFTTDLPEVGKAVVVCIEDHKFEAKNFWNGRWRSVWTIVVSGNAAEVSGLMKVQVHYYELGNVQLVSSKDIKESVVVSSDESTAKEMVKIMGDTEGEYQKAILENYQTMSDTTFKALRRQLPVTRTKIDWNKIVSYAIGKELKTQ